MSTPLTGVLLAVFGDAFRFVRGYSTVHRGIDLSAPTGTTVKSVGVGRVVYAADTRLDATRPWYSVGGGNVVSVQDANTGKIIEYAHLSEIDVKPGMLVGTGTKLGEVGMTGNATGPHLHFAVFDPDKNAYIDPTPLLSGFLDGSGNTVPDHNGVSFAGWQGKLESIGINSDPTHVITHDEAVKIMTQLYGMPRDPGGVVAHFEGKTVLETFQQDSNTSTDPLQTISDAFSTITNPVTWLKVGAVIFGVVLLFKGVTLIAEQSAAQVGGEAR